MIRRILKSSGIVSVCSAGLIVQLGCGAHSGAIESKSQHRPSVTTRPGTSSEEASGKRLALSDEEALPVAMPRIMSGLLGGTDGCIVGNGGEARCIRSKTGAMWVAGTGLAAFEVARQDGYCSIRSNRDVIRQTFEDGQAASEQVVGHISGSRFSIAGDDAGGCYWSDKTGTHHVGRDGASVHWSIELIGLYVFGNSVCGVGPGSEPHCISLLDGPWTPSSAGEVSGLAGDDGVLCTWDARGAVTCIGDAKNWQVGSGINRTILSRNSGDFVDLAFGVSHNCALNRNGRTSCWGWGPVALAVGAYGSRAALIPVEEIESMKSGPYNLCVTTLNNQRTCFGDPSHEPTTDELVAKSRRSERCTLQGESLRCGATESSPAFVIQGVVTGTTARELGCVKRRDGDVKCWTREAPPVSIALLRGAHWIQETRAGELCGSTTGEDLICVTHDVVGLSNPGLVPFVVQDLPPIVALQAGGAHVCGETAQGEVYCWGSNGNGALCRGPVMALQKPEHVLTLAPRERLTLANDLTCTDVAGKYRCWGACRHLKLASLGVECVPAPDCSHAKSAELDSRVNQWLDQTGRSAPRVR